MAQVLAIEEHQGPAVGHELERCRKVVGIDGQAGVDWMASRQWTMVAWGKTPADGPEVVGEIERRLVGHARRCRGDGAQHGQIVAGLAPHRLRVDLVARNAQALVAALAPEAQFPSGGDIGVARQDLLDQRRARTRHPDDQHRRRVVDPIVGRIQQASRCLGDDEICLGGELVAIQTPRGAANKVGGVEMADRRGVVSEIVERLAEGEMHRLTLGRREVGALELGADPARSAALRRSGTCG